VKIALVILHADASRGGAERYTLDLAEGLAKRGHDVSILASSFQDAPVAGTRVLLPATGATRTGRYRAFLDSLDQQLDRAKYDVVHTMLPVRRCDVYHPHAGIAADAIAAGHLNKTGAMNRALSCLGNRFNSRRNKFAAVERELLNSGNPPLVFCLSNLIKGVVKRHYPSLSDSRLVSLFNGVDLHRFDPQANPGARQTIRDRFKLAEDALVGLILAQDFERKGLQQAIEAVSLVKNPKLFLLVGGKPDPSKYQKLAASLGMSKQIIFAGPVSNPVDFYQTADFFVLPTHFDPCSLVVLEALAMGLPVISTVKNGACEVMQDGVHGRVLTDPRDVQALARAIQEMEDNFGRAKAAQTCLQLRPLLSQETHLQKVEDQYRQVIK
jgi:UDP-glucose:(heptosyl)LPS alpha-1,3-glucosyltransferase